MQHATEQPLGRLAFSATTHCLTGCAIGEVLGMVLSTWWGWGDAASIALAIVLAFFFGYLLTSLPLLRSGMSVRRVAPLAFASDTASIATMEVVDNLVMWVIPGAMNAGLVNVVFWVGMMVSLTVAFFAAYPVNRYLLQRGKGHALTHGYHGAPADASGARRFIPAFSTGALISTILAFMVGGLVVSIADELKAEDDNGTHAAQVLHCEPLGLRPASVLT